MSVKQTYQHFQHVFTHRLSKGTMQSITIHMRTQESISSRYQTVRHYSQDAAVEGKIANS